MEFFDTEQGKALIVVLVALASYAWGKLRGTAAGKALVDIDAEIRKRVKGGQVRGRPGGKLEARLPIEIGDTEIEVSAEIRREDVPRPVLEVLNMGKKESDK